MYNDKGFCFKISIDPLWEEAYDLARQRAREEGDVDLDHDEDLIDKWAEEYYDDLMKG